MTKTVKKFPLFLVLFLLIFFVSSYASIDEDCAVTYNNACFSNGKIETDLMISVPNGWKISLLPKITVKNLNNNYEIEAQNITNIDATTYKIPLKINTTADILDDSARKSLDLDIEMPLCSDICTIVHKKLTIDFTHNCNNQSQLKHFIIIMLLAFIGGLILNIMPCVLPIIIMKLRSFMAFDKKSAILGTIIGNYITFATFSFFLILLKLGGEQIGWGMHFQDSNFLCFIAILLFLLLLYSFEQLPLPISFQLMPKKRQIFLENIISAMIASVVAIPCTAPFLGTAATFALQGTCAELISVFFAIATGFSFPYIVALFVPFTFSSSLGKYSNLAKTISNAGVVITFVWILLLLSHHIGDLGMLVCLTLFASSAVFLINKDYLVGLVLLIPVFFVQEMRLSKYFGDPCCSENSTHCNNGDLLNNKNENIWKSYDDTTEKEIIAMIDNAIKQNRIVIFNISADWCLTCKYNKLKIFNNSEIRELIKNKNILCIEGNMTKSNDSLMKMIKTHNRVGIPFTMIFGPKAKEGILLSEIPSIEEVKSVILKVE